MGNIFELGYLKGDKNKFEKLLARILKCSTLLFALGMIVYSILYLLKGKYFLVSINGISIVIMTMAIVLYMRNKINVNTGLLIHLAAVVLALYVTIIYEAIDSGADSGKTILVIMAICTIPSIISSMTSMRIVSLAVAFGAILTYVIACLIMNDAIMYEVIPVLALVLIGSSLSLWYFDLSAKMDFDNQEIIKDEEKFINFFDLDSEQLELLKTNNISREDTLRLLGKMEERIQERILDCAKDLVQSEEEIIAALKKMHPDLTFTELQLCCYIVRGKTVAEICDIRNVSASTVTSVRSRLRTKLGLRKKESLQGYLKTVVHADLH